MMRRRLEGVLPLMVLVGFAGAAVLVNLLLSSARDQGVDALEEVVTAEAAAVARTQDQALSSSFQSAGPLLEAIEFELVVGSDRDREALSTLLGEEITQRLPFGFFLVDAQGTVTAGFGLLDEGEVGQELDRLGFSAEDIASSNFRGAILPVSPGLTTERPAIASVFPLRSTTGAPGALVIEQPVGPETSLAAEFAELGRGETGEYLYIDGLGTVVAATDPSLIGEPINDESLIGAAGLRRVDGKVVIVEDVPTGLGGWHIAFRQDADEFEGGLSRPLESVGLILVLALLAAGFVLTVMLYRRLRAARAEQERLRKLSEAQQELISIVSHELRTPVAGVLGFLETTLDHWDGMDEADRHRAVSRAATNARRLQAMTRDVLDTQSVETGRLVHVMEPLDLADELRTAVEAAKELDPERDFELRVPDVAVWVSGDADRLQQVLANLLDNARKSSPAVEPIEVELRVDDGQAQVAVIDHGAGIEQESLERIFEKFVRGRDEGVTGTGLGLYIARQILDAHGGAIWAESDGGGATFRFRLPVRAPAEASPVD